MCNVLYSVIFVFVVRCASVLILLLPYNPISLATNMYSNLKCRNLNLHYYNASGGGYLHVQKFGGKKIKKAVKSPSFSYYILSADTLV